MLQILILVTFVCESLPLALPPLRNSHVNPWLTHVSVRQKPLQYCKVISLQLIQINEKKKERERKRKRNSERKPGWTEEVEKMFHYYSV